LIAEGVGREGLLHSKKQGPSGLEYDQEGGDIDDENVEKLAKVAEPFMGRIKVEDIQIAMERGALKVK